MKDVNCFEPFGGIALKNNAIFLPDDLTREIDIVSHDQQMLVKMALLLWQHYLRSFYIRFYFEHIYFVTSKEKLFRILIIPTFV